MERERDEGGGIRCRAVVDLRDGGFDPVAYVSDERTEEIANVCFSHTCYLWGTMTHHEHTIEARARVARAYRNKRTVRVLGHEMSYVDTGEGPVIVLLHGNPTSSWLWRGVLPHLVDRYRLVVPDMIGMGDSAKLPPSPPGGLSPYRLGDHCDHFASFADEVVPTGKLVLVVHDWGGGVGLDWASRHEERVRAIAYTETIVTPLEWSDLPEAFHPTLHRVRGAEGEQAVLEGNFFVEEMLPGLLRHPPPDDEMEPYRRPYLVAGEGRRPTLTWPRELPIGGNPPEATARVAAYSRWLRGSGNVPKLFVDADPGVFITGRVRDWCRGLPNQRTETVPAGHFVPEDAPQAFGRLLADWLAALA